MILTAVLILVANTMFRYHGKCLKIARGKVKEDDKYTCPICDWRVKIPRDAARPKLEDLQDWQSEIQGLPFQPEEEGCLASIVNTAQEFRDFMRPYVNPLITSPEEVPTQRFYLRKIEGAEILLAYETNFFRQQLHKWAQVAPQAPPLLEHSLSTRKPRPTKQQKLMAQLGIENPDDLPQNLRTKPHNFAKRKSSEPHSKQAPPTLQPAPHRSVTPSSQSQAHSNSTPAPTANPTTLTQSPGQPGAPYEYGNHFRMASPSQGSPSFAPSSAFLHSHPAPSLGSPTFGPPSPTVAGLESALFNGPNFGRGDPVTTTIGSPVANHFGSGQGSNIDTMFADLTNQDADGLGSSHANDALAVSGNGSEEPTDANLAEQFLNN
jgi:[histone H3]-trimethyl-L-lysine4 demethylase